MKWLVPVGGAAALSAAFNTPIAAVLFTLEEIMGDLHAPVLGSVVLASATAWIVLHLVLGDSPLFHVAGYNLVSPGELLIYALLGVIGGLASVAFVKLLLKLRERFLRFPNRRCGSSPLRADSPLAFSASSFRRFSASATTRSREFSTEM